MWKSVRAWLIGVASFAAVVGGLFLFNEFNAQRDNGYTYESRPEESGGQTYAFWTLQLPPDENIPDSGSFIKFTFETPVSAGQIEAFIREVDKLNQPFGWTEKNREEARAAFYAVPSISIP